MTAHQHLFAARNGEPMKAVASADIEPSRAAAISVLTSTVNGLVGQLMEATPAEFHDALLSSLVSCGASAIAQRYGAVRAGEFLIECQAFIAGPQHAKAVKA